MKTAIEAIPDNWLLVATAVVAASCIGFTIHVLCGRTLAEGYVQHGAQARRLSHILREPYPLAVVAIASVTALLPAAGKVLAYLSSYATSSSASRASQKACRSDYSSYAWVTRSCVCQS